MIGNHSFCQSFEQLQLGSNHLPLISQVLVPRLKDEPHAYTRFFNAPMQVHSHMSGQDKTEKSKYLFIPTGKRCYNTWGTGWSRKYSRCSSQIQRQMCSWNCEPFLYWKSSDSCNPIRLAIPSPHWPTATVKPTRRWSTMCYSVKLGESIDLLKQLPKTNIWAMTTKRLIDCKAAFTLFAWASWSLVTWSDIGNVSDPHGGGD